MSNSLRRACAAVAGIALASLMACESTQPQKAAPGDLPKSRIGVAPRLNASTYVAHGELLERNGNLERAAEQYRKALELTPDLVMAQSRLGVVLNKLGRHGEASSQFRQALVQHPTEAYLYNNLGFSLYLEENYTDAEPVLAKALELQPSFRRARMNYGLVLARLERYDEAVAEFAMAGSEADAHYNVAVIQAETGRYADASRSLEQALRCDPNLDAARDQLRQIARLAAAEELNRPAASEPEPTPVDLPAMSRLATAEEPDRYAASEPEPAFVDLPVVKSTATDDVQTVADVQAVKTAVARPSDRRSADLAARAGRVLDRLQPLLAVVDESRGAVRSPGETSRLNETFDEMMSAIAVDPARAEDCLRHFEEVLGLAEDSE